MNVPRIRLTLLAMALIASLITMVLACGDAAEPAAPYAMSESAPASDQSQDWREGPAGAPAGISENEFAASATAAPQAASASIARQESADTAASPASEGAEPEKMTKLLALTDGSDNPGESSSFQLQAGRQLIVEGWISLEVDDVDGSVRQVEALAAQRDGWVESADIFGEAGYRRASVNIRVPSDLFDNALETLRNMGRVTDEGVSSTDVTDRLIDNQARLDAWKTQEERLIVLLENAASVEDVIDIERRISEVRADIEQVAATQRSLETRVAASLIRVNLHLPDRFAAEPPDGHLTLAVGDPSAAADSVASRVESMGGYVGEKREFQEGRGNSVALTAFVRPSDLKGLMDYAATLGEPSNRSLNSVGPPPSGEVPNARLTLTIRSNVDSAASLSLSASDPITVAGEIRARAESLGGYTESWNESRWDDGDRQNVHMELVVRGSDLRGIMEFGTTLGDTQNWEFHSVGQGPTDAAPNSRLTISVYNHPDDELLWIIVGIVVAGVVVLAAIIAAVVVVSRRRRNRRSIEPAPEPEPAEA